MMFTYSICVLHIDNKTLNFLAIKIIFFSRSAPGKVRWSCFTQDCWQITGLFSQTSPWDAIPILEPGGKGDIYMTHKKQQQQKWLQLRKRLPFAAPSRLLQFRCILTVFIPLRYSPSKLFPAPPCVTSPASFKQLVDSACEVLHSPAVWPDLC